VERRGPRDGPGKDGGDKSPGGEKPIVYSNRAVADNLRAQVRKLKDKIEAAKTALYEWESSRLRDEILRILEAEG